MSLPRLAKYRLVLNEEFAARADRLVFTVVGGLSSSEKNQVVYSTWCYFYCLNKLGILRGDTYRLDLADYPGKKITILFK